MCRTVPPSRAVARGRSSSGSPIRARSVRRPSGVVGAGGSAWADQANLLFSEFVGGRMRVGIRRGGDLVKAVRNAPPTVEVVDVDEPDGIGDLVRVAGVGICASDLKYLQFGSTQIAGHEFAGVLEDGTAVAVDGFFGCGKCEQCEQGT